MHEDHTKDWKDVANSYFDKCIALIILFLMFFFIVYPNVETKAIKSIDRTIEVVDWQPEEQEQIIQEQVIERLQINIEIVDDVDDTKEEEIKIIDTIGVTTALPPIVNTQQIGLTDRDVFYEKAPVALLRPPPVYPEWARRSSTQGTVVLDVEVLIDGSIGAIEVFRSISGLDEAAIEAVRKWKYQPAERGGYPVACWIKQPIVFTLN